MVPRIYSTSVKIEVRYNASVHFRNRFGFHCIIMDLVKCTTLDASCEKWDGGYNLCYWLQKILLWNNYSPRSCFIVTPQISLPSFKRCSPSGGEAVFLYKPSKRSKVRVD